MRSRSLALVAVALLTGCATQTEDVVVATVPTATSVVVATPSPSPSPSPKPLVVPSPRPAPPSPSPVEVVDPQELHEMDDVAFTGEGDGAGETFAFNVVDAWYVEAEWDCPGRFEIEVNNLDGTTAVLLGWGSSPDSGGAYMTGTFYIEVVTDCPWRIKVIDQPNV